MKRIVILFAVSFLTVIGCTNSSSPEELEVSEQNVSYTVTFNENYQNGLVYTATVKKGELLPRPTEPSRAGWRFIGWKIEKTGNVYFNFDKDLVTANITLYGEWDDSIVLTQASPSAHCQWDYFASKVLDTGYMGGKSATFEKDGYYVYLQVSPLGDITMTLYYKKPIEITVGGTVYQGNDLQFDIQAFAWNEGSGFIRLFTERTGLIPDLYGIQSAIIHHPDRYSDSLSGEDVMDTFIAEGYGEINITAYGTESITIMDNVYLAGGVKLQFPGGKYIKKRL